VPTACAANAECGLYRCIVPRDYTASFIVLEQRTRGATRVNTCTQVASRVRERCEKLQVSN